MNGTPCVCVCALHVCNVISIVSAFSDTAFSHLGVHCSVSVLNVMSEQSVTISDVVCVCMCVCCKSEQKVVKYAKLVQVVNSTTCYNCHLHTTGGFRGMCWTVSLYSYFYP